MSKLKSFRPQRANANRHTERGMALLEKSVQRDGWIGAITVAADGETFDGSARLETVGAVMAESDPLIIDTDGTRPVILRRTDIADANDPRAKRLSVAANAVASADWNPDGALLAALAAEDDAIAQMVKNDDRAAKAILEAENAARSDADAEPQIDRAEELREKWQTERGQLWRLGEHRLLCGDSTNAEDVARVMGGEKASVSFTSPPYNVGVSAKLRGNTNIDDNLYKSEYNDNQQEDLYTELLCRFTSCALSVSDYLFVNIQPLAGNKKSLIKYWNRFVENFADVAVWDKGHAAPEQARRVMDSRFEFVIVFSHGGTRAIGTREFRGMVPNVYSGNPQRNNEFADIHAATFPIDLPKHFVSTFTNGAEIIYEPFCGSGTTLIACQNLTRRCRAIEISPAYVAVTLERFATAFPDVPIELLP